MLTVIEDAQKALLLEVGTEKPGNVDPNNDFEDTTFYHFLMGAVGARRGFADAAEGAPVGDSFLRSVRGSSEHDGGNTHFGAVLLLIPLIRAVGAGDIEAAGEVVAETTSEDAARFYEAFDHTDVYVGETEYEYDVKDPKTRERVVNDGVTLYEVMKKSADRDGIAREWKKGFERTFEAAELLVTNSGTTREAIRETYLGLLAEEPDSLVAKKHGKETAKDVSDKAHKVIEGEKQTEDLNRELRNSQINPGTTADITTAGIFVALHRGWSV